MRVMIIDDASKTEIKRVKEYAETHVLSRNDLRDTMELMKPSAGDNPNHKCVIPHGFQVVYSIEDQPCGMCHHLSVSVDSEDKLPSIPAVELLMEEFGMKPDINDCVNVRLEKDIVTASGKDGTAIDIIQLKEKAND